MKKSLLYLISLVPFVIYGQGMIKDTLLIEYDCSLFKKFSYPDDKNNYLKIANTGNNGFVYFLEKDRVVCTNRKKTSSFKKILKKSKSYYEKNKIDDWKLANYLSKYIIFVIKNKECIIVEPVYEIE